MKAWLLDDFRGVGALRIGEIPEPHAAAGEVVLAVRYAALNPADRYLAERQYPAMPPLPHILGRDGIGIVSEIGTLVSGVQSGDERILLRGEVGVTRPGTFAEHVAVPVESVIPAPAGWSEQESAGATLAYLTAYQALTTWGELRPCIVLITGATGGVGVAAVQLAVAMGHTVIALSRSAPKSERLRQLGAAATFNPDEPQWRQDAKKFLAGRRVSLAVDNIGGKLLPEVIDLLGEWGKVSVVGQLAGPVPRFNTASLFFRRIRIGGVAVGAYSNAESRAAWQSILGLLARTGAKPIVDSVFPFDQLPAAFARLAEGPMGKVLLSVSG